MNRLDTEKRAAPYAVAARANPFLAREVCAYILVIVITFTLSIFVLRAYEYGDQRYYREFYSLASQVSIWQIPVLQKSVIGAREPIYGAMVWTVSRALEKDVFISGANAVFVALLYRVFRKYNAAFLSFLLVASGYYTVVCLTSAERLKFSLIFLMGAIVTTGVGRCVLGVLSPASHFQTIALYVCKVLVTGLENFRRSIATRHLDLKAFSVLLGSAGFLVLFLAFNRLAITEKVATYATLDRGETLKMAGITLIALCFLSRRLDVLAYMAPMVVLAYIVGDQRVNIMGYMAFTFLALRERKASHPVFVAVNLYFVYKSIGFIQNVFEYGTGFPPGTLR